MIAAATLKMIHLETLGERTTSVLLWWLVEKLEACRYIQRGSFPSID